MSVFFILSNLSLDLFVCITFGTSGGKSQSLCIYVYFQKAPLIMFVRSQHIIMRLISHHICEISRAWDFPEGPIMNEMKL